MAWRTPKIIEVSAGMEINMCACAARKQALATACISTKVAPVVMKLPLQVMRTTAATSKIL